MLELLVNNQNVSDLGSFSDGFTLVSFQLTVINLSFGP